MTDGVFDKKVALITGSARGIGSVIAQTFAARGAHVVITHRKKGGASQARGESLCEGIKDRGGQALLLNLDISQKKSVRKAISDTETHFGRLDFLSMQPGRLLNRLKGCLSESCAIW